MRRNGRYIKKRLLPCAAAGALLATLSGAGLTQQLTVPNASAIEAEQEAVRRYAVELIIFEYAGSAADSTERFEPELPVEPLNEALLGDGLSSAGEVPAFGDPVAVISPDELPIAVDEEDTAEFVLMPGETLDLIETYEGSGVEFTDPEAYDLTAAYQRLERLDAYRPLVHTRWIQPAVEQAESVPLPLRRIGDPPLRLDGTVTLYLGRFLHLDLDLALEETVLLEPIPSGAPEPMYEDSRYDDSRRGTPMRFGSAPEQTSVFYRIREDRIMRNNEIRYFDHPKFGVIAKVMRIEEAEPEALDTTEDLLPGASAR
jgi:hypothetical protein